MGGALVCPRCGRTNRSDAPPVMDATSGGPAALRVTFIVSLMLVVGTTIGAWLLAGLYAWYMVAVGLVLVAFSRGGDWFQPFGLGSWRWFILFGLLAAIWITVGVLFGISDVYVDNLSERATRIEVDGRPWIDAPVGARSRAQLRAGKHKIRILTSDGDKELDRFDVDVAWTKPYALNVLGGTRYATGTIQYGNVPGSEGRAYRTDKWFRLDYDFLFEWQPAAIKVPEGTKSTTRTYIRYYGKAAEPEPRE